MGLFDLVELMNIFSSMAAMIFYDFSDLLYLLNLVLGFGSCFDTW